MKFPDDILVFGDKSFRYPTKPHPSELNHQATFFSWLLREHPQFHALALHVKNEGKKSFNEARKDAASGLNKGASDIIIMRARPFVCELKNADHTKSKISAEQVSFLMATQENGCFSCIALGAEGAKEAFKVWLSLIATPMTRNG